MLLSDDTKSKQEGVLVKLGNHQKKKLHYRIQYLVTWSRLIWADPELQRGSDSSQECMCNTVVIGCVGGLGGGGG